MNSDPRLMSYVQRGTCVALTCDSLACMSGLRTTCLPNIVIVLADDLGWKDVGFRGAGFPTPNIDRIDAEGVELTRFYTTPVCFPTRVALLTCSYPILDGLQRIIIKRWTDLTVPLAEPEGWQPPSDWTVQQ